MLRQNIPFFEQVPLYASRVRHLGDRGRSTPEARRISSPKMLQQFSPVGRLIRRGSKFASSTPKYSGEKDGSFSSLAADADHAPHTDNSAAEADDLPSNQTRPRLMSNPLVEKKETPAKKSRFFQEAAQDWVIDEAKAESVTFCRCGKICGEALNVCADCIAAGKVHEAGGYLYVKRDLINLDRYWFQLVNKELYCIVFGSTI